MININLNIENQTVKVYAYTPANATQEERALATDIERKIKEEFARHMSAIDSKAINIQEAQEMLINKMMNEIIQDP